MARAPFEEPKKWEALGHHYQALSKTHETLSRQLQSARDNRSVTNRQELDGLEGGQENEKRAMIFLRIENL